MAEMDSEAPQATEIATGNDMAPAAYVKDTALLSSHPFKSGRDITNGTDSAPDTTALLTSDPHESERHIASDAEGQPAQDKTEPRSDAAEIRPLEDIAWRRTSQAAFLTMVGLLFIGLLTAISHHVFYSYLNKRETDTAAVGQNWAIRIGTAFAYLFKTVLVAAISVVYAPCSWFIVRRHAFEIGTLDDFFALLNNPVAFYNRSLYGKASILFGLAMISWLVPISAVFAPGALTGLCTLCES
jgi:hypothetical protein